MSIFNTSDTANSAAGWVCKIPIIGSIISNSMLTCILITSLALIIVMAVYYDHIGDLDSKYLIRSFIYIFLSVVAVMSLHRYTILKSAEQTEHQNGVRSVFSNIQHSRNNGLSNSIPVIPATYDGGYINKDNLACSDVTCNDDNINAREILSIQDIIVSKP